MEGEGRGSRGAGMSGSPHPGPIPPCQAGSRVAGVGGAARMRQVQGQAKKSILRSGSKSRSRSGLVGPGTRQGHGCDAAGVIAQVGAQPQSSCHREGVQP